MLELHPNCECCDKDLPPDSSEAMICTYECTFCKDCVADILSNVCPNCGGGFCQRPVRPKTTRRDGVGLSHQPAAAARVLTKYSRQELIDFAATIKQILPEDR